jgi:Bacterial protein of unknown function (DUF839)/Secretion system C-terminal sorting domain
VSGSDANMDGYFDYGWNVEIDPVTKDVVNNTKLWKMGNMYHENIVVHSNQRTVYQGSDSNPGYLYKYVANTAQNLSAGTLYVYSGSKSGSGTWIQVDNSTQVACNTTLTQSNNLGGTVFSGIEDVEIGPDGKVYFAVKGENTVYRFQDSDPLTGTSVPMMQTFVGGGLSYPITHAGVTTMVPWVYGDDNLAFDGQGNLWVYNDGGNDKIWVVMSNHTQSMPNVKLFGQVPLGAEPTGITFSPDYKFLFMSIQHPNGANNANQVDAAGDTIDFQTGITLVIALQADLGTAPVLATEILALSVNPADQDDVMVAWTATFVPDITDFVVEYSQDAIDWTEVGTLENQSAPVVGGVQDFQFLHERTLGANARTTYYRIKIKHLDGHLRYSNIRSLAMAEPVAMMVFPNPSENGLFELKLSGGCGVGTITATNLLGQEVAQIPASNDAHNEIDLTQMPQGAYLIRYQDQDGVQRLVRAVIMH